MYVFFGLMDVYTYVPQSATDVADADVVGKIDDGESSVGFVRSCALGFVVVVVVVVGDSFARRCVSSRLGAVYTSS